MGRGGEQVSGPILLGSASRARADRTADPNEKSTSTPSRDEKPEGLTQLSLRSLDVEP